MEAHLHRAQLAETLQGMEAGNSLVEGKKQAFSLIGGRTGGRGKVRTPTPMSVSVSFPASDTFQAVLLTQAPKTSLLLSSCAKLLMSSLSSFLVSYLLVGFSFPAHREVFSIIDYHLSTPSIHKITLHYPF